MKEYKGEYNNTMTFRVFKTLNGLYAEEKICKIYNMGNNDDKKTINGVNVIKCSKEDIEEIEEKTYNQLIRLIPRYISSFELQLEINFIVYVDNNHDDSLYIKSDLCEKYDITPISKRSINTITYCNVTNDDLNYIEEKSQNDNPILKRKYIHVEFNDKKEPAKSLFTYYHNPIDNKLYVNRNILEKIREYNIDIEGTPEIIENKNCYTITNEQLKKYEEKSSTRGVEKIVFNKKETKAIEKEDNIETVIVYRDCNTNKLYIDKDKARRGFTNNTKKIMNKDLCETSIIELENKNNRKHIIVDTYTYDEPKEYSFIVCKCNDEIFIPQKTMEKLNIESEFTKKIRVNKEIYQKTTEETLNSITNQIVDGVLIKPIFKKIVPMK